MASLARREDLAGKMQMIYIDPPYGISFKSNFQPALGQKDVKDREQDLTREPEMVKAYRDTWTLGIHSYLAYLRDRLTMAKELLADTGSIFVQISDENLHRVRCVMDEIYKPENFVAQITFRTTSSLGSQFLGPSANYLLWYGRDKARLKFRSVFKSRGFEDDVGGRYTRAIFPNGAKRVLTSEERDDISKLNPEAQIYRHDHLTSQSGSEASQYSVHFESREYRLSKGHWKTNPDGMRRLLGSERVAAPTENSLTYVRFLSDFPLASYSEVWTDTQTGAFTDPKIYVVQTNVKVIERCLLMTTDPGDLVFDPTCGSGTTAYVAEQWGRRWITCDSSRVALALAKHRLLTAKFDFYKLRELSAEDLNRNPKGTWIAELDDEGASTGRRLTFQCKTVPHITLKSIARNTSLDPIFAKHEPLLAEKLGCLNQELRSVNASVKEKLVAKLISKHREQGANSITDADRRRWLLPDTHPTLIKSIPASRPLKGITPKQAEGYRQDIPKEEWKEWQVPFDTDPDWPKPLSDLLAAYREAWRAKMDEVNACIAANAEMEELVDKPEPVKGVVRVTGPFTVEGVIAVEDGPDTPIGGAPKELDTFDASDTADTAVANAEAHLDKILRLLKASGVDFPGNKNMKFARLDAMIGASLIHAEGEWANGDQKERHVAVSIGPEVGNITAMQVEVVIRDANRKGYDDVVFAGFGFDAVAQEAIESGSHPKVRLHMALIRPDVVMGDLLKSQPGSQLFTVFSAPRVKGPSKQPDGEYMVEVEGMDVYDPVSNMLYPTNKDRIAAWFLDTDYDGRTFCICQAFFPDKTKWSKLAKALVDTGVVEEDAFEALSGLTSLPFPRPARLQKNEKWRVAIKVIDPRGNEGLRVLEIK